MAITMAANPVQLAQTFRAVCEKVTAADTAAGGILLTLRRARITEEGPFNRLVVDAYTEAGWNPHPGKPRDGAERTPVPASIRTYVSEIRAAFRLQLPVASFKTFNELRLAIKKERAKRADGFAPHVHEGKPEALQGIRLANDQTFMGAIFHDLAVLYLALPDDREAALLKELDKVLVKYKKTLPHPPEGTPVEVKRKKEA